MEHLNEKWASVLTDGGGHLTCGKWYDENRLSNWLWVCWVLQGWLCRFSATSVRRWHTTAPRQSSSSTAPWTCRTCARRRFWWRMMVSHISGVACPTSPPSQTSSSISAYFPVRISQSRTDFSRIWTDWPQSKNNGLDFGGDVDLGFQAWFEGVDSESEEHFIFGMKSI